MSYVNDKQSYTLANTYNLTPPRAVYPSRTRRTDPGKYEPDHFETATTRFIVLAHFADKTNVLISYNTDLNLVVACHVEGTLEPDAVDNYFEDGEYNEKESYSSPLRAFIIWWDGVDSWLLNEQWAGPDNPCWKRTNPSAFGDYNPQNGATGTATIVAGPE